MENIINKKVESIFGALGLDAKFAVVRVSDRPDLSDFQCNGALALAKIMSKNPREIAAQIAAALQEDKDFARVSVDGPGFINLSMSNDFLAAQIEAVAKDKRLGCNEAEDKKKIVLDFGGPNVAKSLHVGHLRSGVIGESVQRILRFMGHEVVSDVHFGDWGMQIGLIISEAEKEGLDILKMNVAEISETYKKANIRCKEDEQAKEDARIATAKMQDGDASFRKMWKYIRDVSVEDVKKNYEKLDVNFDLWLGESDAHEDCFKIIDIAKEKGLAVMDDGALIIRLDETNKPMPPIILKKTDGGVGYQTTDIATILGRVRDLKAEEIIYFTDQRQALHFEQVFEAVEKLGIAPNVGLKHIKFGTVNGPDGKPFKTRDGGVMNLSDMIELSKDKVRESMPEPSAEYDAAYIANLVDEVAIGAIKFQDLKSSIASGYIFELDDFAKFEGKTGPYIQYAIARINSLENKIAEIATAAPRNDVILVSNKEERDLVLKMLQLPMVIKRAAGEIEPSVISDYVYSLAQAFSTFYSASPIAAAETEALKASRLKMAGTARDILVLLLDLLGIKAPKVILKKEI